MRSNFAFFDRLHEAWHHHHHRSHDCHPHADARWAARHGGFGFGFGGRHGFPGGLDHAAFGRGRKLGAADLQLLLLALLAEKPSHGYELIKALDERSNGYYVPSPGMVYPALTYLDEIGHASVEAEGSKKRYSITEAGLTHLEGNRAAVDALFAQLAWIGKRMEDMRRAMSGAPGDDESADFDAPGAFRGRGRHAAGTPEVRQARRNLKTALVEKSGASASEQRRIVEILERAATEIRALQGD